MILLFLMGKMGITASFAIVYVHTAEMLPTVRAHNFTPST